MASQRHRRSMHDRGRVSEEAGPGTYPAESHLWTTAPDPTSCRPGSSELRLSSLPGLGCLRAAAERTAAPQAIGGRDLLLLSQKGVDSGHMSARVSSKLLNKHTCSQSHAESNNPPPLPPVFIDIQAYPPTRVP